MRKSSFIYKGASLSAPLQLVHTKPLIFVLVITFQPEEGLKFNC